MKLNSLALRHFKGALDLTLEPKGKDFDVYGDNATGKTTLADAWFWLLFGKDSENRADFEIKTIGKDGKTLSGRNHSVEAVLNVEGSPMTLKKTYYEVYTKQRGKAVEEFSGHTTDYCINTVPVQKKEFDARIDSICSEKTFRLLTDPAHFCTKLSWQDRRKMLLSICGDISDADVIKSDEALSGLPAILGTHSLDEYKKIAAARMKEINEQLRSLPSRIDENSRSIPDEPGASKAQYLELKSGYQLSIRELQEQRAAVNAGGAIAEKSVRIREIDAELLTIENRLRSEASKGYDELAAKVRSATQASDEAKLAVERAVAQIKLKQEELDKNAARRLKIREERALAAKLEFVFAGVDT